MTTEPDTETTPVEAYWAAVREVVEWADGQSVVTVEQLPLVAPPPGYRAAA